MKNASLALNGVLLVAVAVLFYLHFSSRPAQSTAGDGAAVDLSNVKVAFINSDSLSAKYEYVKVNLDKLEAEGKKLDAELQSRAQGLQREFEDYQRSRTSLTIGQAQAIEEGLMKKRQNLEMYQQTLGQQMMEKQGKASEELYNKVTAFLKKYGEEKGLQVVLKYNASSDVLYGVPELDITKDVVEALNADYKLEGAKGAPVKKDTTAAKK
jgi:outer membrane protein